MALFLLNNTTLVILATQAQWKYMEIRASKYIYASPLLTILHVLRQFQSETSSEWSFCYVDIGRYCCAFITLVQVRIVVVKD